jgi:hypothetical protein
MPALRPHVIPIALVLALVATSCRDKTPSEPSCIYGIASVTLSFPSNGGQGTAAITTGAGCTWTATADSAWLTFPSGSAGSGPATLVFAVAANAGTESRKGLMTVAGQALSVSQEGRAPCEFAVSPTSITTSSSGGTVTVSVATSSGCQWTVSSSDTWISSASPSSGSGSATVSLIVAPNAATDERQANVTVAGRSVSIRQAGAALPPTAACEYSVSPVDAVLHWHATGLVVTIAAAAGCAWTASTSDNWLSLDRTAGSGPGSIAVSFSSFIEDASRRAAVQVRWPTPTAGQNVWITQEGCRYGFESSATFPAAGGSRMLTVVTQALSAACSIGCPWSATANASWIHVASSMPRAGDDAFTYLVDANSGATRVGTLTVAGRTHTVTQAGY